MNVPSQPRPGQGSQVQQPCPHRGLLRGRSAPGALETPWAPALLHPPRRPPSAGAPGSLSACGEGLSRGPVPRSRAGWKTHRPWWGRQSRHKPGREGGGSVPSGDLSCAVEPLSSGFSSVCLLPCPSVTPRPPHPTSASNWPTRAVRLWLRCHRLVPRAWDATRGCWHP